MSEQSKPFVVTDRRKFTIDGTPRPDADPSPDQETRETRDQPASAGPEAVPQPVSAEAKIPSEAELPPPPTAREMEQAGTAYKQTSERLDTAVRAANPGVEHLPEMSFEQIVQSIYMTTIMQLGGTAQEGQQPKVDLMGARQSVDMLAVLAEKTRGNLTPAEAQLMENALFEVRMGFLEVTQALARSAATRQPPPPGSGASGPSQPGRPIIVR